MTTLAVKIGPHKATMALTASRMNVIGESGLGEPEQDANSALIELDKGLRSGNVGEQCEAIVRFPRLFEKYPFPILINSSFLKLADVFRVGNNFMRVWVLRVCQQSERHLDKILNVDEFVRRVFSVTHSNDPVARALALHVLGSVASIIPEREQVHHSIRNSLDSHDTVEVLAAVSSAGMFAAHSRTFAVSMCNKIAAMIQGLDTPVDLKLKLIPVLRHMHYTTSTAAMVRELGGELLQSYPAKDFILTSHDTLTKLAIEALVDIPHQVTLLLASLDGEPRSEVRLHILRELKTLAHEGATHWPAGAVATLLARAQESKGQPQGGPILASCLDVISVLAKSATLCHDQLHSDTALMDLCIESCYSVQPQIICKAICIMTNITCYCYKAGIAPTCVTSLESSLESFLLLLISGLPGFQRELRLSLKCMLQLCQACPQRCQFYVQLLTEQMHGRLQRRDQTMLLLMETLAAIASIHPGQSQPPILLPLLPELLSCINNMPSDAEQGSLLCTLVLQTCQGYCLSAEVCSALYHYSQRCPVWECYKLARAAMRYGLHLFAVPAVSRLARSVSSEHFHFWLACLREVSQGECALLAEPPLSADRLSAEPRPASKASEQLLERLTLANTHYAKAITAMKAASSPHNTLQFATEYLRLRSDTLQCLSQLVQVSLSLLHPPPAIAMNQAQTSGDELLRHGRTTIQLRKVAQEFRLVADNHAKLAQSAFDADPKTLANIKILQSLCLLLSRSIDSIVFTNYQERNMIDFGSVEDCPEMHHLVSSCQQAAKISEEITSNRSLKPISYQHIESLLQQVEIVVTSPLCLPRYFFQVLQSTTVKLSISPQSRLVGELSVQANMQMVLRVEGVCQHQGRPGLFRSITGVKLVLSSALQSSRTPDAVKDGGTNITQTVQPHHDFFSAQFLLSFSQSGQYQICVTAALVDTEGRLWRTGPKTFLVVKVYDDQSQASTAAQPPPKSFAQDQGGQRSGGNFSLRF